MQRRLRSKHLFRSRQMCLLYLSSLSLAELTQVWTLEVGSDRSLGRPKEWNGEPSSFDDFAFKFSNWLSWLPGDAERFLEEPVTMAQPIQWATLAPREVVARGVATALRALIGGKALSCIRHHPEKLNGFEMWRLLYKEYEPDTATRKSASAGKSDGRSTCTRNGLWRLVPQVAGCCRRV